jgi:FSR family fosmidomycin resistance protein-like MFS transporter
MQDKTFRLSRFITVYSVAHFLVDAACAFLLLGVLDITDAIFAMLLYNAFAFVLQAPFGYLIDKYLNPKGVAVLGLLLIAIAFIFTDNPLIAISIVSIGNALYHVGGGSLVLSVKARKATYIGVFVAPGALGLAIGSLLSISSLDIYYWFFPLLLVIISVLIYFISTPNFNRTVEKSLSNNLSYSILIIALIMLPITVRSLIGLSIDFPWKENKTLLFTLVSSLALGKVFGGILADRYGLLKVGVGGLLISSPLLAFYATIPFLGILGAFIFNFTMPVTLIAILYVLPNNKGLSFGLTTVALFIGALPTIFGKNIWLKNDFVVLCFTLLASMVLFAALRFMIKLKILTV